MCILSMKLYHTVKILQCRLKSCMKECEFLYFLKTKSAYCALKHSLLVFYDYLYWMFLDSNAALMFQYHLTVVVYVCVYSCLISTTFYSVGQFDQQFIRLY